MKIGIDLRFIDENIYSTFILQLIGGLIASKSDDFFNIYTAKDNKIQISKSLKHLQNTNLHKIESKRGSFTEQTKYKKVLKKDANHLMLFFDQFKPIFYKKDYITFLGSLKDFYYSNFSSGLEKNIFYYLAEKNFKRSKKIICLDTKTKDELIERFNIHENKIEIISGFFPKENFSYDEVLEQTEMNLAGKYAIKNPFFIYSGGNSIEKNYEKLVSVFHKLKQKGKHLDLVFLGDTISSNVGLRNLILEKNMQEHVFFLGEPNMQEKKYLYNESLGVIFPSFYEPFPLKLSEALYFEKQIIASDLKKIREIFGDKIDYFSPISENSILKSLEHYMDNKKYEKNIDYSHIKEQFTLEKTLREFEEIFDKQ